MPDTETGHVVILGFIGIIAGWIWFSVQSLRKDWRGELREVKDDLQRKLDAITGRFDVLISTDHVHVQEFQRRGAEIERIASKQAAVVARLDAIEDSLNRRRVVGVLPESEEGQ